LTQLSSAIQNITYKKDVEQYTDMETVEIELGQTVTLPEHGEVTILDVIQTSGVKKGNTVSVEFDPETTKIGSTMRDVSGFYAKVQLENGRSERVPLTTVLNQLADDE
jgi:hypothetical protein